MPIFGPTCFGWSILSDAKALVSAGLSGLSVAAPGMITATASSDTLSCIYLNWVYTSFSGAKVSLSSSPPEPFNTMVTLPLAGKARLRALSLS